MKRKLYYFLILIFIISCKGKYNVRKSIHISIQEFKMDNSSIRAIEIVNDSTIAYAGSIGDIGIISESGSLKDFKNIKTHTIIPHFRALSYTNEALYALNIANPALLYQYKNEQLSIVYKEEHEKVFYDSMAFFDELNGIAMGDPINGCLSIITTRNGGNSWQKIPCKDLLKVEDGEAAFAASNTNIAIVGKNAWIATGGLKSRIFHTPDMGVTWKVYNTPIVQGKNTTGIYSVDFYDKNNGIICGGDYLDKFGNSANKAITTNGGKTWQIVSENKAPKYVSCVQYIPNTQGKELMAVSTNGIFYSNDTGKNWMKISENGYYSIRFANKNTAWLSGNEVVAKMTIH